MMLQDMTLILTKASSRSCCKLVSLCHVVFTGPSNFDQGAALQVELVAPSLVRSYCVRDLRVLQDGASVPLQASTFGAASAMSNACVFRFLF